VVNGQPNPEATVMEPKTIEYLTAACAGELRSGSRTPLAHRVCTDSRLVQAADLFVALSGDRFDGHRFLAEVARKGAVGAVVARDRVPADLGGCAVIAVEDPRSALGRLAAVYRREFTLPVIAVGGSNGKTTTKELIASTLSQLFRTLWSEASFNNDIGVPATLLRLEAAHRAAVIEVGTNHPGELAPLVRMVAPDYGVITNVGREHLEFFGDSEGVAREEGWLAELLPASGTLFVNGDDPWTPAISRRSRATTVRVGLGSANDWRASGVRLEKGGLTFKVAAPKPAFCREYRLQLLGRHQVWNALFAVALGSELGLTPEQVARGLAECKPAKMRMQVWELNGVRVLDDAYNANADSMAAALATLHELPCKGRKVAVLGDMAELGTHSEAAHEEVGRRAAESGVGQLFAIGKSAAWLARGARIGGLNRVFEFADVESAAQALKRFVKSGDLVLLKASRAARLERVAEVLRSGETGRRN